MRVCVPCSEPGGPDSPIVEGFEGAEITDYYELLPEGRWEHIASTRSCGGGMCVDPVDAMIGRKTEIVAVLSISLSTLTRLATADIKVFKVENPVVRQTLDDLAEGRLMEITKSGATESQK